jgi:hypothetical protein
MPQAKLNPWSKVVRHAGMLWGVSVGWLCSFLLIDGTEDGDTDAGVVASVVGAILGILVAIGYRLRWRFRKKAASPPSSSSSNDPSEEPFLPQIDENNPWNARLKAGVVWGEGIGRALFALLFALLPIPFAEKPLMLLGGAIGGVLGGLVALVIPGWNPSTDKPKKEANPASERIRSGAMLGGCVGIVVVFLVLVIAGSVPLGVSIGLTFGAGLFAALGSLAAYFCHDAEEEQLAAGDQTVSNPWSKRIRAGVQWGACLGMLLGVLLPGLGLGLTLMQTVFVGAALFSVGGALLALVIEPLLVDPLMSRNYETDNPWVPRCRLGVALGTSVGMLIGCVILLCCPVLFPSVLFGVTLVGAIGGLVGGVVAVLAEPMYLAYRGYYEADDDEKTAIEQDLTCTTGNSYSERCRTGVLVGAAIGAGIGFFLPIPGGLFLGSAIGGVLGAGVAALIRADWDETGSAEEDQVGVEYVPLVAVDDEEPTPQGQAVFHEVTKGNTKSYNQNNLVESLIF